MALHRRPPSRGPGAFAVPNGPSFPNRDMGGEDLFHGGIFSGNVSVNLVAVGVVVRQGRVNLSQREVLHFGSDLFGAKTEVVPPDDAAYRDTGAGDAWPAFANFRRPLDESSNIHGGPHAALSIDRDGGSRTRSRVVIRPCSRLR